jgi:hypothetical protein
MPLPRLLDGLLVMVARHVRSWADRTLAERDLLAEAAPPEDDGPPADWLEMVRTRAPHLLANHLRAPRAASPLPPRCPSPSAERAARPPAGTVPAAIPARVTAASPAIIPAACDVPPRCEPPASAWTAPPLAAASSEPEHQSLVRRQPRAPAVIPDGSSPPAGAAQYEPARSPGAEAATDTARSPGAPVPPQERAMRGRWRIAAQSEPPPARQRGASGSAPTEATAQEHPPSSHAPRPGTGTSTPRPLGASPEQRRPVTPAALPDCAALPRSSAPRAAPLPRAAAPIPTAPPANATLTEWPPWSATDATPPAAPFPAALPVAEPPRRSFDRAHEARPHPRPEPPPPVQPLPWPCLPDDDEPADAHAHGSPPATRPTEPTWPALPDDEPAVPEAPVFREDHNRSDRLRGEQQGARWTARHS